MYNEMTTDRIKQIAALKDYCSCTTRSNFKKSVYQSFSNKIVILLSQIKF